jgi:hypothetical protein
MLKKNRHPCESSRCSTPDRLWLVPVGALPASRSRRHVVVRHPLFLAEHGSEISETLASKGPRHGWLSLSPTSP